MFTHATTLPCLNRFICHYSVNFAAILQSGTPSHPAGVPVPSLLRDIIHHLTYNNTPNFLPLTKISNSSFHSLILYQIKWWPNHTTEAAMTWIKDSSRSKGYHNTLFCHCNGRAIRAFKFLRWSLTVICNLHASMSFVFCEQSKRYAVIYYVCVYVYVCMCYILILKSNNRVCCISIFFALFFHKLLPYFAL